MKFALAFLIAALLGTAASAQEATSQLQGYAVLQPNAAVTSQLQGYAVLAGQPNLSQLQGYAILCTPPGVGACPAAPVTPESISQLQGYAVLEPSATPSIPWFPGGSTMTR